jgi:membrane-associated phospholipid phosphatase
MDGLNLPSVIPNMILGGAIGVAASMAINTKWKISIHMLGMGSVLGLLIGMVMRFQASLMMAVVIVVLASGLVGYARLRLDAHTPGQVYAGFLLGIAVMCGAVIVG